MPNVSIIIGAYNLKDYQMAEAALQSIMQQTYLDFEVIICNDGSTDNTLEILHEIISDDSRFKIIQNEINRGLAYSLNRCLAISKGKYIARMDMDDISYFNRIEKEYDFLERNPEYTLVSTWADLFEDDKVWGIRKYNVEPQKIDFLFTSPILHAAMMIRRDALQKLGGYRVSWETTRAEDYDLFMRMYAMNQKAHCLPEILYKIREDKDAFGRRKYRYRLQELVVRYKGFKSLGLLPRGIPYVIKPLIVGLIPQSILKKMRKNSIE